MRTRRRLWLAFLVVVGTAAPSRAEQPCDKTQDENLFEPMVAREARAYFYSRPAQESAAPQRLRSFVVLGDLVEASRPSPNAAPDPLACAVYLGARGSRKYGWVRTADFAALPSMEESPEPSPDLKGVLSRLAPVKSWPTSGVTPYPCHDSEDFVGDFVCVHRADLEKKEICVSTTHRPYGPAECGTLNPGNRWASFDSDGWYNVYLFNNAIAIVSQEGAWGNHGQSDPAGVYVFSHAAERACRSGRIAPAVPYDPR